MKRLASLLIALVFACGAFAQDHDAKKQFFDMKNCSVCKCMADMSEHMMKIKWETHMIENGFLQVTVIPDELKDKWSECEKSMDQTLTKLESGKKMDLCGYCSHFGKLLEAGAKKKELDSAAGKITLVTSDDPAVIKKIHAMAKKVKAEHKKMLEMMKNQPEQKDSE